MLSITLYVISWIKKFLNPILIKAKPIIKESEIFYPMFYLINFDYTTILSLYRFVSHANMITHKIAKFYALKHGWNPEKDHFQFLYWLPETNYTDYLKGDCPVHYDFFAVV